MGNSMSSIAMKIILAIVTFFLGGTTIYLYNYSVNSGNNNTLIHSINNSNVIIDGRRVVANENNLTTIFEDMAHFVNKTQTDNKKLKNDNKKLKAENDDLISRMRSVQYITPQIQVDGLFKNFDIINPVAFIDDIAFFSQKFVERLIGKKIEINLNSGEISINSPMTGKIYSLMDTVPPYQYQYGEAYVNGETFTMSGKKYTNGFVLRGGVHKGFALINLQRKFSSLSFYAGHVDGTDMFRGGTNLTIYIDGNLFKKFYIPEDRIAQKITIPLNYANELKIQAIRGGGSYGIANAILTD